MTRHDLHMLLDRLSYPILIALVIALLLAGCLPMACQGASLDYLRGIPVVRHDIGWIELAPNRRLAAFPMDCYPDEGRCTVVIDTRRTPSETRMDVRHELCHIHLYRVTGDFRFHDI